jgi:hypothetical protein
VDIVVVVVVVVVELRRDWDATKMEKREAKVTAASPFSATVTKSSASPLRDGQGRRLVAHLCMPKGGVVRDHPSSPDRHKPARL